MSLPDKRYRCEAPCHEGDPHVTPGQERFWITGCEAERAQGGTNHVELRARTGVVWCANCVEFTKLGGQPSLL